jgi:phosphatidate cytidylyltransferase
MLWVGAGMLFEWYEITEKSWIDTLLGLVFIPQAVVFLILTRMLDESSLILLYYFIVIWSVDTFAMFGGKKFKGPKLAPKISPQKTWSGLFSGVFSAVIIVFLINLIPSLSLTKYLNMSYIQLTTGVLFLGFLAQASDLFESYFKRKYHFKDSGYIIPGHGGVLDRFDSIILTAWIAFFTYCSLLGFVNEI